MMCIKPNVPNQCIGQASDVKTVTDKILRFKSSLIDIQVKHTGMLVEKYDGSMESDHFMNVDEAATFRLIDEVEQPLID